MSIQDQKSSIASAILNLQAAQQLLIATAASIVDQNVLVSINDKYSQLDDTIYKLIQTQMTADDVLFTTAVSELNQQVILLQSYESELTDIIRDVKIAGEIIGYIVKAASTLSGL